MTTETRIFIMVMNCLTIVFSLIAIVFSVLTIRINRKRRALTTGSLPNNRKSEQSSNKIVLKKSDKIKKEIDKQKKLVEKLLNEWAAAYGSTDGSRQRTDIAHSEARMRLEFLQEDYLRSIKNESSGTPELETPSECEIIENEYREQMIVCRKCLTIWSNLYDKVQWGRGTVRERIEADVIIDKAYKNMELEDKKLDILKNRYKQAVYKEMDAKVKS